MTTSHGPFSRKLLMVAAVVGVSAIPLSAIHPALALLSLPLCAIASYSLFNVVSRTLVKKPYQPPTRNAPEWCEERAWSDWLLFGPEVVLFVSLLLLFGDIGDCLSHKHMWLSWWSICAK